MNKLNQLAKIIILSLVVTSSCSFKRNSFENYSQTINETLNPASSNLKEVQNIYDVRDVRGCGMAIELGVWKKDETLNKRIDKGIWSRSSSAYDRGIIGSGEEYIDFRQQDSTPAITKNPLIHIVYIGPWHYSKKVGKEIRFVAYTGWGGGDMSYQFETKTPENQNISSREYNLPAKGKIYQRTQICIVKWIANHGYNSISKVKSKNPFSKNYMVPTGEIIEVED